MPAAYKARGQSLNTVGGPQAPQGPQVDIAGAIDALTGGATSLIHATMIRKQNERAAQQQAAAVAYQRGRDKMMDDRYDQEQGFKREQAERDFMLQGGVPARTTMDPTGTMASVAAPKPPSPIARAMQAPDKNGLPAPSMMQSGVPDGGPTTAPLPASTLAQTNRPATVDPTKSRAYVQATDVAELRGKVAAEGKATAAGEARARQERQIQAGKESAEIAQKGRLELERLRQSGKGSKIRGGMTVGQVNTTVAAVADGIIGRFEGDREAAYSWLNSDDPEAVALRETKDLKDKPLQWGTYLDNARAKFVSGVTTKALSHQQGPMGDSPKKAVERVNQTRQIASGAPAPTAAPAASAPMRGAESMAPVAAASPFPTTPRIGAAPVAAVPAAKPDSTPAKAKTKAKADTVTDDQFTEAELDAAIDAGVEDPKKTREFILNRRKQGKK